MATVIFGDWGTSQCRLWLVKIVGQEVKIIAECEGLGAKYVDDFASYYDELCNSWYKQHVIEASFLSGMIGSSIGWELLPYVSGALNPQVLLHNSRQVYSKKRRCVTIIPGFECHNQLDLYDVMRGEEIQILGVLDLMANLDGATLCMPGTHCKWVEVSDSKPPIFTTSFVGELFDSLMRTTLVSLPDSELDTEFDADIFTSAALQVKKLPHRLLQHLFSVRSKQLNEELSASDAATFLSGLLIASDIQQFFATNRSKQRSEEKLIIVANQHLIKRYQLAAEIFEIPSVGVGSDAASLAGFTRIWTNQKERYYDKA